MAKRCPHSVAPIATYHKGLAGALNTAKRDVKNKMSDKPNIEK
jgi:hypothetical protein